MVGTIFCGVDILIGKENGKENEIEKPILCEVNSNAYIKGIFEEQGRNIAEDIVGYILEEILKRA